MKSLSIIEMNKVARYLGAQSELALTIEGALEDFEHFYEVSTEKFIEERDRIVVLLGSERGFCGGFNEAVLECFTEEVVHETRTVKVIVVGRKLASKLEGDSRVIEVLEGPSGAEEIAGTIAALARRLSQTEKTGWTLVHHEDGDAGGRVVVTNPFALRRNRQALKEPFPPLLSLAPEVLYPQLFEQYLFSVLYQAFYLSFLAENRERLRHMEGALGSLDKEWTQMKGRSNILRQEEITEELEVIMLSVNSG